MLSLQLSFSVKYQVNLFLGLNMGTLLLHPETLPMCWDVHAVPQSPPHLIEPLRSLPNDILVDIGSWGWDGIQRKRRRRRWRDGSKAAKSQRDGVFEDILSPHPKNQKQKKSKKHIFSVMISHWHRFIWQDVYRTFLSLKGIEPAWNRNKGWWEKISAEERDTAKTEETDKWWRESTCDDLCQHLYERAHVWLRMCGACVASLTPNGERWKKDPSPCLVMEPWKKTLDRNNKPLQFFCSFFLTFCAISSKVDSPSSSHVHTYLGEMQKPWSSRDTKRLSNLREFGLYLDGLRNKEHQKHCRADICSQNKMAPSQIDAFRVRIVEQRRLRCIMPTWHTVCKDKHVLEA